jgi:hypothetical protein
MPDAAALVEWDDQRSLRLRPIVESRYVPTNLKQRDAAKAQIAPKCLTQILRVAGIEGLEDDGRECAASQIGQQVHPEVPPCDEAE